MRLGWPHATGMCPTPSRGLCGHRHTVKLARDHGFKSVSIGIDCCAQVKRLNSRALDLYLSGQIIEEIQRLFGSMVNPEILWVKLKYNFFGD